MMLYLTNTLQFYNQPGIKPRHFVKNEIPSYLDISRGDNVWKGEISLLKRIACPRFFSCIFPALVQVLQLDKETRCAHKHRTVFSGVQANPLDAGQPIALDSRRNRAKSRWLCGGMCWEALGKQGGKGAVRVPGVCAAGRDWGHCPGGPRAGKQTLLLVRTQWSLCSPCWEGVARGGGCRGEGCQVPGRATVTPCPAMGAGQSGKKKNQLFRSKFTKKMCKKRHWHCLENQGDVSLDLNSGRKQKVFILHSYTEGGLAGGR